MTNRLRIAPPPTTPQQRIAPPTPTYYVWAMDSKGLSRRLQGPLPTLVGAQHVATRYFRSPFTSDCFVYVVGWRGYVCIGHWHNLFGPDTGDTNWQPGDIRNQVRKFIMH
jgi:hypothetical protein